VKVGEEENVSVTMNGSRGGPHRGAAGSKLRPDGCGGIICHFLFVSVLAAFQRSDSIDGMFSPSRTSTHLWYSSAKSGRKRESWRVLCQRHRYRVITVAWRRQRHGGMVGQASGDISNPFYSAMQRRRGDAMLVRADCWFLRAAVAGVSASGL